MRILLLAASALALSIGTSSLAQGRGGGGHGGGGKPERAQQGGGHGGGHQAARGNRGGGHHAARGNGGGGPRVDRGNRGGGPQADRGHRGGGQSAERRGGGNQRAERGPDRARGGERRAERVRAPEMRGNGRGQGQQRAEQRVRDQVETRGPGKQRNAGRMTERRPVRVADAANIARMNWEPSENMVRGCPPGLARKDNGCMPPGQLRQQALAQSWYGNLWNYPDATEYFYDDGYLFDLGDNGSIDSYIPLLGGALWDGNAWPAQYEADPVPDYHLDYFGLDDGYDYRFADGAIYGVDPTTQMIQQVAALVTGDQWNIGQQMPEGYDVYNVPYDYRDEYQDSSDAMYRYSDGYVYQVDPTTQLIQAAIQLIT